MTANAMAGDRERCLEAGMDDYVSKPVSPESLDQALSRFIERAPRRRPLRLPPRPWTVRARTSSTRSTKGGSLLVEVIDTFLRIAPVRLSVLGRAAGKKDAGQLERTAHSFLGSCANLGAVRMAEICALLETRARGGSVDGVLALVEELHAEYGKVKATLEERRERVRARE